MSAYLLRNELQNHRGHAESMAAYRARRAKVNAAVQIHLGGRFAHVSSRPATLPVLRVDPRADEAVLRGLYRDMQVVTLPGGKQVRVGRTKGVTFRYPDRAAHRKATLAASRAARQ